MLVSMPKEVELRTEPGHSGWQLRGPTDNAPGCAGSQLWTGYSDGRAVLPMEARGRAADCQVAGTGEEGVWEKGLTLP